ncbi:MAG TPA: aldehyde dehydrogenase family protein [Terriglobia bacterium]|nr:aldehyde dehydrogenase family protein [Terriglobia bacterium]
MQSHSNFIEGKWVPPATGLYYETRNPAHPRETLGQYPSSRESDGLAAIAAATKAFPEWRRVPGPQRGALLFRFAQLLEEAKVDLGRIITLEQGKAIGEAIGEVSRAATEARYIAGEASRTFGNTFPSERQGVFCYTMLEPLGVVAAISPWNFPVVAPVRKIAPALACGNTVVVKPASLTPGSAVFLAELFEKAGFAPGVVNLVIGAGSCVGRTLVDHRSVRGISFTGSTAVGIPLYECAARRMAKVQLELGGKNPAVVVDCDDLEGAAREIVAAAFLCSGQRCTALSRVIVANEQADVLLEHLVRLVRQIKVGDGLSESTNMGPLVSKSQLEVVDGYVKRGIDCGAVALTGGRYLVEDPDDQGYFYAPTVLDRVKPDSPVAREEIFGPVLPILRVRDHREAIAVANDTPYGLAASLFTSRLSIISEFIETVESGMVHVNHGTASQAHVPFGGVKDSGQGSYSIGPTAKDFFTSVKSVYVKW